MPLNFPVKRRFGQNIDMVDIFHFQILDTTAASADYVVMWGGVPVKTVRADAGANLLDLPEFCQQGEVAVNGSQADFGKCFLYIQVNRFGSGMVRAVDEEIADAFPLAAVFNQCASLLSIIVINTDFNIIYRE